ncbi:putative transmembrane protein [Chlamydia ibidis]|uniref:Transmembrane protein n=2 Tax=Chlamydia ibidis TaxID=1405396 RepID=A0ABN0MYZ5_9CHLA|nr:hypothetical protein [Chlamydia ibidis]EPP34500.1 putative transmembrane protein [Chlamydia ibidis]EQM62444.1 putative transmembrane protein [Chlamydia ibidis 10-1398/6]
MTISFNPVTSSLLSSSRHLSSDNSDNPSEESVESRSPSSNALVNSPLGQVNGLAISQLPPLSPLNISPYYPTPKTCQDRILATAEKISLFLRNNWKYILLYVLAWSLILACHYTVALTLTIWLGIGLGAGVVFGIFTANVLDRDNKYNNINSLWNLINYGLLQLDPNGTRQFLLATIIASISSLIYAIPEGVGFMIGACIGNQISIMTTYGIRLGNNLGYVSDTKAFNKKVLKIKNAINQYQIIKHQLILQQQIAAIVSRQNDDTFAEEVQSIELNMNHPLPYMFDTHHPNAEHTLHFTDPNLSLSSVNQSILALSQVLVQLNEEPNRVVEG